MACIFCRSLAWLQHKLDVRAQRKAAQTRDAEIIERNRQDRSDSYDRERHEPPPTPLPPPEDSENLETLRARIPPRSHILNEEEIYRPPIHTDNMEEACRVAADMVEYYISVAITEGQRELVAVRAARAVATAVSTTPAYPVFVAAVTMAESMALIYSENPRRSRYYTRLPPGIVARRRLNALNAAVEAGMAAHAGDISDHGDNARPLHDDDSNGSDRPAHTGCSLGNGIHETQPGPGPQDDSDPYSESIPLLDCPSTTQCSAGYSSPSPLHQTPTSRSSTSTITYQWPG